MGLWEKVKDLFKESEQSSPTEPVLHELIERSPEEITAYEKWVAGMSKQWLVDWILAEYKIYLQSPGEQTASIDFLNTPSCKGFIVHFKELNYKTENITHLFDYFKSQVRGTGYKPYMSDVRIYNRSHWVETVQRHYLKPPPSFTPENRFPQRYGNITIELKLRDEELINLRFNATRYHDRNYEEAHPFSELMERLLV